MIADKVPIQNIYYLLCYAWNHLQESQYADVRSESCSKIWDLLANVVESGSTKLIKRGLHRSYLLRTEQRSRPKGKILFSEDIRKPVFGKIEKTCEFDELSSNILPNQIIRKTIRTLLRHDGLNPNIRKKLLKALPSWDSFDEICLRARSFKCVKIHRNMKHYRFLLNVCELIYSQSTPNVQEGGTRFRDFLRDEARMGELFERFVFNFLKREQVRFRVSSPQVRWHKDSDRSTEGGLRFLPSMNTDIVLEDEEQKLIIDCKFYRDLFQNNRGSIKFRSAHLYQIFAYLKNQETVPGWENVKGMLLYPTVGESIDEQIFIHGHEIRIASIDLNQDWEDISDNLKQLFEC